MNQLYELEQQDNLKQDEEKLLYFQKEINETFKKNLRDDLNDFFDQYEQQYGKASYDQINFGYKFVEFLCNKK